MREEIKKLGFKEINNGTHAIFYESTLYNDYYKENVKVTIDYCFKGDFENRISIRSSCSFFKFTGYLETKEDLIFILNKMKFIVK
jgi:hypothetical protein